MNDGPLADMAHDFNRKRTGRGVDSRSKRGERRRIEDWSLIRIALIDYSRRANLGKRKSVLRENRRDDREMRLVAEVAWKMARKIIRLMRRYGGCSVVVAF